MSGWRIYLLTFVLAWHSSQVFAKPPELKYVFPAGGQRGAQVDVTCHGDFDWPVQVWCSNATVKVEETQGKITVSLPADLSTDRIWLRLYNKEGASQLIPFLVSSLPELNEKEANDDFEAPQKLADTIATPGDSNVVVNGTLEKNGDVDSYAVHLAKGQTLVAAIDANSSFGSPMDAILQVTDSRGILQAENHDDVGLDPRLAFTAPSTGSYIVRVFAFPAAPNQRIEFHGGNDYVYRLTLTTRPFVTHCVPLLVQQSETGELVPPTVEVRGWNIPPGARLPVAQQAGSLSSSDATIFAELSSTERIFGATSGIVRSVGWVGAARVRMWAHPTSPKEIVSTVEAPFKTSVPQAVTGCLQQPGKADYVQLALKKSQQIRIRAESVSVRSSLVPSLKLLTPDGKVAARVSERGSIQDATIDYTSKHDGDHTLVVSDRFQHGGPRHFYRLQVCEAESGFSLSCDTDSFTISKDKPLDIVVKVKRSGDFVKRGQISIEATDLPAGITSSQGASKPDDKTKDKVTIQLTSSGVAYSGPIRIRGRVDDEDEETYCTTPAKFGSLFQHFWLTVIAKENAEENDPPGE